MWWSLKCSEVPVFYCFELFVVLAFWSGILLAIGVPGVLLMPLEVVVWVCFVGGRWSASVEWRQHVWGVAVRFGFFWVLEAGFCTISKEIFFFGGRVGLAL